MVLQYASDNIIWYEKCFTARSVLCDRKKKKDLYAWGYVVLRR